MEVVCNSSLNEQHRAASAHNASRRRKVVGLLICYVFTPNTWEGKTFGVGFCLLVLAGAVCFSESRSVCTHACTHTHMQEMRTVLLLWPRLTPGAGGTDGALGQGCLAARDWGS